MPSSQNPFSDTGIYYLESSDFDSNHVFKHTGVWFIMIQAGYCGACTSAKPKFVKAKEAMGDSVKFATIDAEDEGLSGKLKDIFHASITTIPTFFLYRKDGKSSPDIVRYKGSANVKEMVGFLNEYSN